MDGCILLEFGENIGILPAAAYLLGITVLAVLALGLSLKSRVALVAALAAMHLSWGWGFLRGFVRGATGTVDKSRVAASGS